jgi:uncharacterized protein
MSEKPDGSAKDHVTLPSGESARSEVPGVDAILARHGGISYLEIPAKDVRRSAAFYQQVFGWKPRGEDGEEPKFSDRTGHLIGKWITGREISRRPGWLPYIYVDGIEEAVERVAPNGGQIVKPPFREGNLWVAVVRDPAGNVVGLWQEQKPSDQDAMKSQ